MMVVLIDPELGSLKIVDDTDISGLRLAKNVLRVLIDPENNLPWWWTKSLGM